MNFTNWISGLLASLTDLIPCSIRRLVFRKNALSGKIEHVFVLMLENRSFDHMLGFSGISGTDTGGRAVAIEGLEGTANAPSNPYQANGGTYPATHPASFKLTPAEKDPGHEFFDTFQQLYNKTFEERFGSGMQRIPQDTILGLPNMNGFINNYHANHSSDPSLIMKCFQPSQLPVLTTLARNFAVCDQWFSSMPGPTWPNRHFIHAASSGGLDDSPSAFQVADATLINGYGFRNGTIYDRLDSRCLDWRVYHGDMFPQVFSLKGMASNRLSGKFKGFDSFKDDLLSNQYTPSYTFIEPDYGDIFKPNDDFTCGNSQHPLDDVTRGERLIKEVYEAIRNSPHWERSVLIITYDEHGGFFDHVPPPACVAPGDGNNESFDAWRNHHDFNFKQLGVRVPAVIVSPWIKANTVDKRTYDHTSVLKTVEEIFGLKSLTERDRNARGFGDLFSLEEARQDFVALPDPADSGFECHSLWELLPHDHKDFERAIDSIVRGFLHVAFLRDYHSRPVQERDALVTYFLSIKTKGEAHNYMYRVRERLKIMEK